MGKPRFVNVYVFSRPSGELFTYAGMSAGTRLEADCAAVGWERGTDLQPHLIRHLREAGVAFRVVVRMKP